LTPPQNKHSPHGTTRRALLLAAAGSLPLHAGAVPRKPVERLGKDLTPVGAERAGNKAGTIPAWDGGIAKPPAGFDSTGGWLDPFAAEKPLYTVTAANAAQYKDLLSVGQQAMLSRHGTYKLKVYPTHRTAAYSAAVYRAISAEAADASTESEGNALKFVYDSRVPFPIPQSGVEVIWNHVLRFRGNSFVRPSAELAVQADGSFTSNRRQESVLFGQWIEPRVPNLLFAYRVRFTEPASLAGQAILVHETIDQVRQPRAAWLYSPATRRVMRAPELAYDFPRDGVGSLSTLDDYDGFTGSPDRYDWKLIGKREMLISYNNFALTDKKLKYKDLVRPGAMNQELVRYELHRVWVVEGNLKPGKKHIYSRRVYFIDEDSWQIAHGELYDSEGKLWRVLEQHAVQYYDAPCLWIAGSAQYDLKSTGYVLSGLTNEERPLQFDVPMNAWDFTSDGLRRLGQ
jgi:hypothetical protein